MRNFLKNKLKYLITTLIIILASILITQVALADIGDQVKEGLETSATQGSLIQDKILEPKLSSMVGAFINNLFGFFGLILVTVILIGGYKWMAAGGNEESIAGAKKIILNGIFGMMTIFISYALVWLILNALGLATGAISK